MPGSLEFPGEEAVSEAEPRKGLAPNSPTPPLGLPLPVMVLVEQAQRAEGAEQQQLALRINQWLAKLAREDGGRPAAEVFHRLLEGGRLEGLVDETGEACGDAAVRGLLALGFPYALEVRPEDLERLRTRQPLPASRRLDRKALAAAAVGAGAVGQLGLEGVLSGGLSPKVTLEVGALLLALVPGLMSAPGTPLRRLGLVVLVLVSVTEIFLGMSPGYAGLVSGLAGLVACLLIAGHEG
ncbi:hypothetical protein POL68_35980 [Stigmatella sp. ncwal1]|uniref:Uncharacterized protein n=1 Tax=Stigmatella ashevillensis TaxID=2995309 RepID=A0ABT5DJT7_9BACT|nr:hypothetical protein [Stigmatella ashevillena]MDC0713921.1 hypothetical protein [Stigmatella ashevillena]